jgi:fused signal recognition particle receptor
VETATLVAVLVAVAVAAAVAVWLVRRRRARPALRAPATPAELPPAAESAATRLRRGLLATSRRLREQVDAALGRGPRPLGETVAALEEALIGSDVGVATTTALLERVRARVAADASADAVRAALRGEMAAMLRAPAAPPIASKPWVILVTGVNGVGKTTTIGKLAARHVGEGRKVLVVAADTFRAAAIDQLAGGAERTGADLVRHAQGADPAAVVFDGAKAAVARGVDVVLVDTAGRLHTRTPLMDELRKLRRVLEREIPGAPHETLLVLDATTGQNALSQARTFTAAVEVGGIVLTKLDGTARGGVLLALRHELGVPVRWIGVGEAVEDLRPFDADEFVDALFGAAVDGRAARVVPPGT